MFGNGYLPTLESNKNLPPGQQKAGEGCDPQIDPRCKETKAPKEEGKKTD